jgi:uncharacterized protein YbjT (DUF2867 family)
MRIAVVGGTGVLGRRVLAALAESGHESIALSRKPPIQPLPGGARHMSVDLITGAGLEAALADGVDAVVDASNGPPTKKAERVLATGTSNLLDAERDAGVRHHVCVSIVGCERVPIGYYEVKARQEQAVASGAVPWTIVRATQFHDLLAATFERVARARVLPIPSFPIQPLDVDVAAALVADTAQQEPRTARVEIAGPRIEDVRDLARTWREATGKRVAIVRAPWPGKVGRALAAGALTNEAHAAVGTRTFAEWLSTPGAKG